MDRNEGRSEGVKAPDIDAFETVCAQAVRCNRRFPDFGVARADVDVAQPRFVGPDYWNATERRVILAINPGAGKGSPSDRTMRSEIVAFRDGILSLGDLFRRQRKRFGEWGRTCWGAHTRRALEAMAPTLVIACGGEAQAFALSAGITFAPAPHYAARFSHDDPRWNVER